MRVAQKVTKIPRRHILLITGSLLAITAWTLIRFFDQPPTFDLVGQQVLAWQWLHGIHSGVFLGPTNYILKIVFLYIPFSILPFSALTNLILMTLLINLATFLLIFLALKYIWQELCPDVQHKLDLPLFYLALICGSVFWIQFSNSRNLEVAGGLFLIYLCLRVQRSPSLIRYVGLSLLAGLLFFADPLQIYMAFLPAVLFMLIRLIMSGYNRSRLYVYGGVVAAGGAGILLSKALVRLVGNWLNVTIQSSPPATSFFSIHQWVEGAKNTAEQMARLYAGGSEGGRARMAVNLLATGTVLLLGIYLLWKRPKSRPLLGLAAAVAAVDVFIYIASNQANQGGTNRYLIMTVPFFILVTGLVIQSFAKTKIITALIIGVLALNILTLAGALIQKWDPHFSKYNHARQVATYMKNSNYKYGYAGMDTAIVADYISKGKANLLPLGCQLDSTLRPAALFFDKGGFDINKMSDNQIPLILDGSAIVNTPSVCTSTHIQNQFGNWEQDSRLNDGSQVLLYSPSQINR